MPETSPHSIAREILESLSEPKAQKKRALFIRDDGEGRGRRLYKQIRNELERTGLDVFELSDFQSLEGRFFEAGRTGAAMAPGASLSEQSLFSALGSCSRSRPCRRKGPSFSRSRTRAGGAPGRPSS
jgi:hypothetical protein